MGDQHTQPLVRAVHCDHRADDDTVYEALARACSPLSSAWQKLEKANRITIKFNQAWPPDRVAEFEGRYRELIDPAVARALLRLLRERTNAEIVSPEIATSLRHRDDLSFEDTITLLPVLDEYGVEIINGNVPPHRTVPVPGGGAIFSQYLLPECVVDTDAFITVQKIKNHRFMGVTLGLKNLFGLPPYEPYGRSRQYFHHLVRLPYVLVDLGRIIKPTLTVLDGLVAQAGSEWGGTGRVGDVLVAGDDVIATDACATRLMGHDPLGDWPDQPFVRDRNSLVLAHALGLGTADLDAISFESEVQPPLAEFLTQETDPFERVLAWRRSTCEQALHYRDHMAEFHARYAGKWILLQNQKVVSVQDSSTLQASRRVLSGSDTGAALWFKYVDPQEAEGEHFEVYEQELAYIANKGF